MPAPFTAAARQVCHLWLNLQGFSVPRGHKTLSRESLVDHLEQTGALQLDSVNALARAHYVTLWSRFGPFEPAKLDRWVYEERLAYEYWGHEASILPRRRLPLCLRRMRRFPPPALRNASWWSRWNTSPASKRRVRRLLERYGELESADIRSGTPDRVKEDKRSLQVLWHQGIAAVSRRRHFRKVYALASAVYPPVTPASGIAYEDSWLLTGLKANGIASEAHLVNYWTAPRPDAAMRARIIRRCLKHRRIVPVRVQGFSEIFYALPEHLDRLRAVPAPQGTTFICPFDSLLWQRRRAEELLHFRYRVEIYVPAAKRRFGYYVCPILHNGRFVGRLDPKMHRNSGVLEVKHLHWEAGVTIDRALRRGFRDALESLASFVGARDIVTPQPPALPASTAKAGT